MEAAAAIQGWILDSDSWATWGYVPSVGNMASYRSSNSSHV